LPLTRGKYPESFGARYTDFVLKNITINIRAYWRAYRRWKRIGTIKGIDAAGRMTRSQAHERR